MYIFIYIYIHSLVYIYSICTFHITFYTCFKGLMCNPTPMRATLPTSRFSKPLRRTTGTVFVPDVYISTIWNQSYLKRRNPLGSVGWFSMFDSDFFQWRDNLPTPTSTSWTLAKFQARCFLYDATDKTHPWFCSWNLERLTEKTFSYFVCPKKFRKPTTWIRNWQVISPTMV